MTRRSQRGVALMTAIILVALAAVLAVGIAFSSAMSARRSAAVFSVEQGLLFAQGAEAFASFVLREDAARSRQDTPLEGWHEHYGPVEVTEGVSLEAQLEDEAGKFNLNSLVDSTGNKDPLAYATFTYLLDILTIQGPWADRLLNYIDRDDQRDGEDSLYLSQSPPRLAINAPITSISELMQLPGFGMKNFLLLKDHVTALPTGTKLNLCTADADVLNSLVSAIEESMRKDFDPTSLTANRKNGCFPKITDFKTTLDQNKQTIPDRLIAETTDYFRLSTIVSLGTTQFALYSLMWRSNGTARPVLRTYGID